MDEEYKAALQSELDNTSDMYEDQQELMESQQDNLDATYPSSKPESNIFNLFWKVLKLQDSTKVGNLNKVEIGDVGITVRDSQKLGMLGHLFHHKIFGDYFFALGEVTSSTSMSRDGWFSELFVSQKKFTQRSRKSAILTKEKLRLFGKKTQDSSDQQ
jgi:hypothetical protein